MDFPPIISTIAVKPADLTARLFWHGSNLLRLIDTDYCQGLGLEAQMQFALTALLSPTVLTDLPLALPIQFQSSAVGYHMARLVDRLHRHFHFQPSVTPAAI